MKLKYFAVVYFVLGGLVGLIALSLAMINSFSTAPDPKGYILPGLFGLIALLALIRGTFVLLEKKEK